jgi:hypothetical protein
MNIDQLECFNYNNTEFFSFNGFSTICRIINVLDGDTLVVIFHFFNNFYKFTIRLYGIDTCEIKSNNEHIRKKGLDAKNYVISLLCLSNNIQPLDITFVTKKDVKEFFNNNFIKAHISCKNFDKFGRILSEIYLYYDNNDNFEKKENSISFMLLNNNLAYPYFGETKLSDEEIKEYFHLDKS